MPSDFLQLVFGRDATGVVDSHLISASYWPRASPTTSSQRWLRDDFPICSARQAACLSSLTPQKPIGAFCRSRTMRQCPTTKSSSRYSHHPPLLAHSPSTLGPRSTHACHTSARTTMFTSKRSRHLSRSLRSRMGLRGMQTTDSRGRSIRSIRTSRSARSGRVLRVTCGRVLDRRSGHPATCSPARPRRSSWSHDTTPARLTSQLHERGLRSVAEQAVGVRVWPVRRGPDRRRRHTAREWNRRALHRTWLVDVRG